MWLSCLPVTLCRATWPISCGLFSLYCTYLPQITSSILSFVTKPAWDYIQCCFETYWGYFINNKKNTYSVFCIILHSMESVVGFSRKRSLHITYNILHITAVCTWAAVCEGEKENSESFLLAAVKVRLKGNEIKTGLWSQFAFQKGISMFWVVKGRQLPHTGSLPCSYHITLNHHLLFYPMKLFRYVFWMVSQDIFYHDRENLIDKTSVYEESQHLQFISQNSGQSIYTTATLPFSPSTSIVMFFFWSLCLLYIFISKLFTNMPVPNAALSDCSLFCSPLLFLFLSIFTSGDADGG